LSAVDLTTEYVGLRLANPLVVASAGITETVDRLRRIEGAGAAVMKSWFETDRARTSPTPRFRLLRRGMAGFRSTTLYSFEQASGFDLDRYAEEVRRAKDAVDMPVFASANCVTDAGWVAWSRAMEQAGADALELNVSCPFGPQMMGQVGAVSEPAVGARHAVPARRPGADALTCGAAATVEQEMQRITRLVKATVATPVATKMTPQLANPVAVAKTIEAAGADGLVMFNRFTGLDLDLDQERPIMHGAYAGHGGAWALQYVLRWISASYPAVSIPIASSGGVADGDDVAKLILCGATVVETCAAVVLGGPGAIPRLLRGLTRFMQAKGYMSPEEFRGKACARILESEEVDRRRLAVAAIDEAACTACARCARVCIYEAARPAGDKYEVVAAACSGCGLCQQVCPADAIHMTSL